MKYILGKIIGTKIDLCYESDGEQIEFWLESKGCKIKEYKSYIFFYDFINEKIEHSSLSQTINYIYKCILKEGLADEDNF